MKRTHDKFYIKEVNKTPIKEAFKMIADNLADINFKNNDSLKFGDIGCAAGALPNYIKSKYDNLDVNGFEYSNDLLSIAKKTYPNVKFSKVDVTDPNSIKAKSLDIITMSGVLCIFDNSEKIISNLLKWIKPNGRILIFNMFNEYDLDVFIKYKHSNEAMETGLESGWNIVSQKSISLFLKKKNIKSFKFTKFEMPFDLPKKKSDYVRAWTEKDINKNRYLTNGLNIIQPFYLLQIDV